MTWLTSAGGVVRNFFIRGQSPVSRDSANADLMIVRAGLSPAFYFFCQVFAKERRLQFVSDRRVNDRRHAQRPEPGLDRRQLDRRMAENSGFQEDFRVVRRDSRPGGS